jgi:lysophospholipase L1-like esterase
MAFRKHRVRVERALVFVILVALPGILGGCAFNIDRLVPHHGNVGDLLAVRTELGIVSLSSYHQVMFADIPSESIFRQTSEEVVVVVPSGLAGEVPVSVWAGFILVSNIKPFRVDTEPIVYRILGFGDSLMGPWAYHTHMLDTMLNENVGPSLVINEGRAGETMSQGAERLAEVLSIHSGIQYICILEGANDVADWLNTPLGEMLSSLEQMIDLASSHSIEPILLTVPPRKGVALSYDQTWPTTEDWNDALRTHAILNGIEWFDLHQAFVTQPGWESFLDEDGLHLSEEGQEFVASAMYPVVASLLE